MLAHICWHIRAHKLQILHDGWRCCGNTAIMPRWFVLARLWRLCFTVQACALVPVNLRYWGHCSGCLHPLEWLARSLSLVYSAGNATSHSTVAAALVCNARAVTVLA